MYSKEKTQIALNTSLLILLKWWIYLSLISQEHPKVKWFQKKETITGLEQLHKFTVLFVMDSGNTESWKYVGNKETCDHNYLTMLLRNDSYSTAYQPLLEIVVMFADKRLQY